MRKKEKKINFKRLIMVIILLALIVGCVILIVKKIDSKTKTVVKNVEKQNVELIELNYISEDENVVLNDENEVEKYLNDNTLSIFGKKFSSDIRFKFAYKVDVFENKMYVFCETYKGIEISNIEIMVSVDGIENKLSTINGSYVEPIDFETEIFVDKDEAYKTFLSEREQYIENLDEISEEEDVYNLDEINSKLHLINSEFIIHGYKFNIQEHELIVDANTGGIVKIEY